jgi:hypothetical protein
LRKRGRISLIALTVAVVSVVIAVNAVPSGAAASGGNCRLSGTAAFDTPLGLSAANFTYSFSGALTQCVGTAGPSVDGTVEAGKTWTDANGTFQEPKPTGNGSCGSSTTAGTSIIKWADGATTVVKYSTTGALAAVALTGNVLPSITLSRVDAVTGLTVTTTIVSTRYYNAGSQNGSAGQLAFHPGSPTDCQTGVKSAGIDGATQVGTT